MSVIGMQSFRQKFWGDVPSSSERRQRITDAVKSARDNWVHLSSIEALDPNLFKGQLVFRAEGKIVCEKYFANLVGMGDSNFFKNKMWKSEVKRYVDGIKHDSKSSRSNFEVQAARCKRDHAYAHIKQVVESQVMDMSAHANFESHLYLPYQTVTCFFDEYVYLSNKLCVPLYAKKTTFTTAFEEVVAHKKRDGIKIRLSSGKGIYSCAIFFTFQLDSNDIY
jgi:hypothetical protein